MLDLLSKHKIQVIFNVLAFMCCFVFPFYIFTSDKILTPLVHYALFIGGQPAVRTMAEGVAFLIALVGAGSYLAIFFLQVIWRDVRLEK